MTAKVEGCYVTLNDGQMWDYEIPLRELRTESGLKEWIDHLSEKTWVTQEMLDFVSACGRHLQ